MSLTILGALENWVSLQPNKSAWNFIDESGKVTESFSYLELDRASTSLAAYLLNTCGIKSGDRLLLVFIPGLHYAVSLIACFKAGIIAVPVFPPDPRKLEKDIHHFVSIASSSGSKMALTHGYYNFNRKLIGLKNIFISQQKSWPDLKWIEVDDVIARAKAKVTLEGPKLPSPPLLSDIAFLQYTSGSTSEPKGVMISHANLAHNEMIIIKELKANPSTVCVSWLPQYHDMGLIGSYLGSLFCGGTGYYMSPLAFLKDPVLWLHAMSLYKGSHTQAPSFAYALVTRKFKEALANDSKYGSDVLKLDLTSVSNMLNAAEPVDEVAINDFYNTFEAYGIRRGVVIPTYGLAEHTVFVCSGGSSILKLSKSDFEKNIVLIQEQIQLGDSKASFTPDKSAHVVVGCGFPTMDNDVDLVIVNDSHQKLGDDSVRDHRHISYLNDDLIMPIV
jgi:acyl-CoA synthetase (AMP-forming)/AMP-acid ligase II